MVSRARAALIARSCSPVRFGFAESFSAGISPGIRLRVTLASTPLHRRRRTS